MMMSSNLWLSHIISHCVWILDPPSRLKTRLDCDQAAIASKLARSISAPSAFIFIAVTS